MTRIASSSLPDTTSLPGSFQLIQAAILLGILLPVVALVLVSIVMLMSAGTVAKLRRRRRRAVKKRREERVQDLMERVIGLEGRLALKRDQEKEKTEPSDNNVSEEAMTKE